MADKKDTNRDVDPSIDLSWQYIKEEGYKKYVEEVKEGDPNQDYPEYSVTPNGRKKK